MVKFLQSLPPILKQHLSHVYSDVGPERCGVILDDGTLVEVQNVFTNPEVGFEISVDDMLRFETSLVATFHTHPGQDSNLSNDDFVGFQSWPNLKHIVVGNDGLSVYAVTTEGKVVRHEA